MYVALGNPTIFSAYYYHIWHISQFCFDQLIFEIFCFEKAKRKAIVVQMYDTEKSYVEALKILVTVIC